MPLNKLKGPNGHQLAYIQTLNDTQGSERPGIVFLPGLKSDMYGTKAVALEEWCSGQALDFLRFDYSGHGQSEGVFLEGTIGDWYKDAEVVISDLTSRPNILVGSSMGGWISLLLALRQPELVHALVLIAPAPDFTSEFRDKFMTYKQHEELSETGRVVIPSDYDEPYIFTKEFLDEGDAHTILDDKIKIDKPVRFLHGKKDTAVSWEKSVLIESLLTSKDTEITLFDDGDHSLSRPEDLEVLCRKILSVF